MCQALDRTVYGAVVEGPGRQKCDNWVDKHKGSGTPHRATESADVA